MSDEPFDIVVVGASAAGLAATIFAAESAAGCGKALRVVALEGARKPGAKILVSGGGRCNVTNERISSADYSGGPQPVIRNVLRAFDENRTISWMREMGVELKLEPTGKYFPTSDKARTVLDALLARVRELGADLRAGERVSRVVPMVDGQPLFRVELQKGAPLLARRLIMATGGLSLPKSGSDGAGLNWMRQLGHTVTPTTPALVPLMLDDSHPGAGAQFAQWAGLTLPLRLTLVSETGKQLASRSGSTLFTHFGLSGPAPMDLSREITQFRLQHPGPVRVLLGHADIANPEQADIWLQEQLRSAPRRQIDTTVGALYPERIAAALTIGLGERMNELTRESRLELARRIAALPVTVTGDRGYAFAETTAGGVDLREIDARTMQSRKVPGLHICGEMLDVDGRIGGFNFQWAWASGYLAGRGSVASLLSD